MNGFRGYVRELVILTILLSLAVSLVNAFAFVYYPMSIGFEEGRTILLKKGTNVDMVDLNDIITVELKNDKSVSVLVHPSKRGTTYYKDLIRIINTNTQACNITFIVNDAFKDPVREAKLILRDAAALLVIGIIDLKKESLFNSILLDTGCEVILDLRLVISSDASGSGTALIQIVCL